MGERTDQRSTCKPTNMSWELGYSGLAEMLAGNAANQLSVHALRAPATPMESR